jgi:hypothetical protein
MANSASITDTTHSFPIAEAEARKLDQLRGELTEEPFISPAANQVRTRPWIVAGIASAVLGIGLFAWRNRH